MSSFGRPNEVVLLLEWQQYYGENKSYAFFLYFLEKKPPQTTTPLTTVITMDLGGLTLKDTKIPINPLNLVTVRSTVFIF